MTETTSRFNELEGEFEMGGQRLIGGAQRQRGGERLPCLLHLVRQWLVGKVTASSRPRASRLSSLGVLSSALFGMLETAIMSQARPAGSWGPPAGRAIENSFAPSVHRRCADPLHLENRGLFPS